MLCNSNDTITPALLRICEVAAYLAVSERTAWNLIKEGKLKACRFGKVTRIERSELDRFISECKGGTA